MRLDQQASGVEARIWPASEQEAGDRKGRGMADRNRSNDV